MQLPSLLVCLWKCTASGWGCLQVTWSFILSSSAGTSTPHPHPRHIINAAALPPSVSQVPSPTLPRWARQHWSLGPCEDKEPGEHSQQMQRWNRWMASASSCPVPGDRCCTGPSSKYCFPGPDMFMSSVRKEFHTDYLFTQDPRFWRAALLVFPRIFKLKKKQLAITERIQHVLMALTRHCRDLGERAHKLCYEMDIGGRKPMLFSGSIIYRLFQTCWKSQKRDWWKDHWESSH